MGRPSPANATVREHVRVCLGLLMAVLLCCIDASPSALAVPRADAETSAHAMDGEHCFDAYVAEALEPIGDEDASSGVELLASLVVHPTPPRSSMTQLVAAHSRALEQLVCTGLGRGPPLG